jgi:predicted RecB family endonuclease
MGGLGSGRPSGSGRTKVESCRSIDVNRLHKAGCLRPGWSGAWQWTRDGEQVAIINLRAETDGVDLSYRVRASGGEWQDVRETVRIVHVSCRVGGARPYFICPGVVNGS